MKNLRNYIIFGLILFTSIIFANKKSSVEIKTMNDFYKIINSNKPTIIKFYAPWCGASKAMIDTFDSAADTYKTVAQFINIDVTNDDLKDVLDMYGIQATPTIIYKEIGLKDKNAFAKRLESFLNKPKQVNKKPAPKKPISKKPISQNNTKSKPTSDKNSKTTSIKKNVSKKSNNSAKKAS